MSITISCSWCNSVNSIAQRYCKTCGHEAIQPRNLCQCAKCVPITLLRLIEQLERPPAETASSAVRGGVPPAGESR